MTKRAFLVLGGESTGTRLLTSLLMLAGCDGDDSHEQRWDQEVPKSELVVWRRSVPHSMRWPDIPGMADYLRAHGYFDVRALVISRDWYATARSQVRIGHAPDVGYAERNLAAAYPHIFRGLAEAQCPWRGVSYEGLASKGVRRKLCEALEIPVTEAMLSHEFVNANARYYEGEPRTG